MCISPTRAWEGDAGERGPVRPPPRRHLPADVVRPTRTGSPDYSVGIATAKSPLGPWTKSTDGPILEPQRQASPARVITASSTRRTGRSCSSRTTSTFATDRASRRVLAIDRVHFVEGDDADPEGDGPTTHRTRRSGVLRERVTPSPRYSGERVGERGERRATSTIVRFVNRWRNRESNGA